MENTDDDIYILSGHDTLDGSVSDPGNRLLQQPFDFVISRSPGSRPDPAVQALQQAYSDLKKRFNEKRQKNDQLTRALRDVGKLRLAEANMSTYGESPDEMSISAQGAAATGEHVVTDDNVRARLGYVKYLEREKVNNEARIQQLISIKGSFEESCNAMQRKYKDAVSELERKDMDLKRVNEIVTELKEDNMQLREERDSYRRHASDIQDHMHSSVIQSSLEKQNRSLEDLQLKYKTLEAECDTLRKEGDRLQVSENLAQTDLQSAKAELQDAKTELQNTVKKAKQEFDDLRSRNHALEQELLALRESDLPVGSSMTTADELVHLKKVISDLRRTVIQQREFLSKLGRTSGMVGARSEPNVGIPKRVLNEENGLGPSWETVPTNSQLPQTGVYVKDGDNLSPRRIPGAAPTSRISDGVLWNSSQRRSNSSHGTTSQMSVSNQEHSRSEVLRRRPSDNALSSLRSKSEVIVRAGDTQGNVRESSPFSESQWRINGAHIQPQSSYENIQPNTRRKYQAVVSDDFRMVQDNTPAFPVPPELRPNLAYPGTEASPSDHRTQTGPRQTNQAESAEKVCPVCSRDFAPMPMEDFQTHVFECFDDSSAPETLRPGQIERICPMCNDLFPETVPQEEFEKHVQTHFEQEITDRFEILDP
ncbi:tax1-binding protein 1 homolog [Haliotis rufescens]|uniref:tax1-binding protein 1 homolog n=1 Tax=Haliotis rufescens TaxID=6454 RepID=UPI00201F47B1|nr:tax1-binding protein 1 homolog [Haliotis rufescens]XP_048238519.1 tax1-binding protein 1 homolog [Haliotis rufescens]XP_048238520.1 tax1-binding protein 1 homolog [Haliotis rufescens]XP_048238521.1 tax1-binding protein 1 homolog [Haliotis rufescens]XP_048238522.1 tax1-binding protein 1 homolog [Haliotis rufescens]XP_048238523.1 tax1-binding protein 1 homolog [Haliotis rufescens]XP_048238524.1 tax1-binding protein 1 homolog [Haliotis rufescens]